MTLLKQHAKDYALKSASCLRTLLATSLLTFSVGAHADDIDIYTGIFDAESSVGTSPSEINPNIMFILDDSGSMNSFVLLPVVGPVSADYDSTVDYGKDGNAANDSYVYIYSDDMTYLDRFVTDTQNRCQAQRDWVAGNPNNPIFFDQAVQWQQSGGDWEWDDSFSNSNNSNLVFECADDRGVHAASSSSVSWPENCRRGCNSSSPRYRNRAPNNNRNPYRQADNFNLVTGNYHDYLVERSTALGNTSSGDRASDCRDEDEILIDDDGNVAGQCNRKLTVMKRAMNNALDSFNDVNIGLMDFNANPRDGNEHGGTQIKATGDINDDDFLEEYKDVLDDMRSGGNTPLAESLYEAYLIFSGGQRRFGEVRDDDDGHMNNSARPITYKSPINNECQSNNIVLLSDGEPTQDRDADGLIEGLLGAGVSCTNGSCLDELAGYMAKNDMSTGANGVRGNNAVFTYTIGFNIDNEVLVEAANAGRPPGAALGSGYFRADDILALENAFRRIIGQIQSVDADTFVAPAVTVNAYNRLQNREDIYYVVFKPNTNARWNGNLKKYKVSPEAIIEDKNGNNAISEATGFFKDEAQSFWSDVVDGPDVEAGGMGEQRGVNRALYGNLNSSSNVVTLLSDSSSAENSALRFLTQTSAASVDIGVDTSLNAVGQLANAAKIAAWTLGRDVDGDGGEGDDVPTNFVGDNIHGQPYVLSFGTTDADPQDIIFFTSNQGMLHAVTGDDRGGVDGGTEAWAYVPDPSLFKNFGDYYNRQAEKVYGLDAEMAFDVRRNVDNEVTKAVAYFGQRRGGDKVFAVDVINATRASNPVSKIWTIEGGVGDFARMGQTWAEPVVAQINYCAAANDNDGTDGCPLKDVLILSGGYDDSYDDAEETVASLSGSVQGNAVYIVDAANGDLLWMAGSDVVDEDRDLVIPEMTHSIPSKPTALDVTQDGAIDFMFLTDISGQIFRIDFKATAEDDNSIYGDDNDESVAGGLIADLSQSSADRRFYNPVDVTLLPPSKLDADTDVKARYALVTGSGYRANPLAPETYGNNLYVVFDYNIFEPLYDEDADADADADVVYEAFYLYANDSSGDLAVIDMDEFTNGLSAAGSSNASPYGFFVAVSGTAEKFITPTLISDFRAIAVSYLPDTGENSTETCSAGVGSSNAYELNLLTGETEITELTKPGLTAEPVVLYVLEVDDDTGEESLKPIVIIGTEPFKGEEFNLTDVKLGKAEKRAWWELNRAN